MVTLQCHTVMSLAKVVERLLSSSSDRGSEVLDKCFVNLIEAAISLKELQEEENEDSDEEIDDEEEEKEESDYDEVRSRTSCSSLIYYYLVLTCCYVIVADCFYKIYVSFL